jgi:hypothetical protein
MLNKLSGSIYACILVNVGSPDPTLHSMVVINILSNVPIFDKIVSIFFRRIRSLVTILSIVDHI